MFGENTEDLFSVHGGNFEADVCSNYAPLHAVCDIFHRVSEVGACLNMDFRLYFYFKLTLAGTDY